MWKWRLTKEIGQNDKAGKRTELSLAVTPGHLPQHWYLLRSDSNALKRHAAVQTVALSQFLLQFPSLASFCPSTLWLCSRAEGAFIAQAPQYKGRSN